MAGQIGLEPTPDAWVARLVEVFREVRRVLRLDGTMWLNCGDAYATGAGRVGECPGGGAQGEAWAERGAMTAPNRMPISGLKSKDLIGLPWMLAFALRADGWWLRSDIIWHKPNPMPESIEDRPTKAHEHVFLLTKASRYYYNAYAIREPGKDWGPRDRRGAKHNTEGFRAAGQTPHHGLTDGDASHGRNKRTVWTIPSHGFPGAHFATFPPALVEPCLLAGTSERGVCPTCGAPWRRQVEPSPEYAALLGKGWHDHADDLVRGQRNGIAVSSDYRTVGWAATCACPAAEPVPGVVLDPFSGAGTTGLVALRLGRDYLGIDLSPEYTEMARKRIVEDQPLLNRVSVEDRRGGAS